MNYGLTQAGFRVMRQDAILGSMKTDAIEAFGGVQTDPESALGQLLGVQSKPSIDVWEQLGNIFYSLNPETATGVALDYCVSFNGIKRLGALPSSVIMALKGTNGFLIPEGTLVRSNISNNLFKTLANITLSYTGIHKGYVEIEDIQPDTVYQFAVGDGITSLLVNENSGPSPDIDVTIDAMVETINTAVDCPVTATNVGNGVILLHAKDSAGSFVFINLDDSVNFYNTINCQSIELGSIPVSQKTIDIIETPVTGLDSVNNFEEGVKGREKETDPELRLRRRESIQIVGSANLEAIVARMIREVTGVTACRGYENVEDTPDIDGRPAHSIEIIVDGGDSLDIGNQLWKTKGGGIKTFGNTSQEVTDSNGDIQTMFFSRPVIVYGWVYAYVWVYNEEIFPTDGLQLVKDYIYAYGQTFKIGLDMIPQRFLINLYPNIPGIERVDISLARTALPEDSPLWDYVKIPIAANEIATFHPSRIFSSYPV